MTKIVRIEVWSTGVFEVTRNEKGQYSGKAPIDTIEKFHQKISRTEVRKITAKKIKTLGASKELRKIQKSLRARPNVKDILKSGESSVDLTMSRSSNKFIKIAYEKLFGKLIKVDSLLPLVIRNAPKFKHRLFYRVTVTGIGKDGKLTELAYWEDQGKTIEEVVNNYKKENLKTGMIYTCEVDYGRQPKFVDALKLKNFKHHSDGVIRSIKIKAELRKGS